MTPKPHTPTSTGHPQRVRTESEKLLLTIKALAPGLHDDEYDALVRFVIKEKNDDYFRGCRTSIVAARLEAATVLTALKDKAEEMYINKTGKPYSIGNGGLTNVYQERTEAVPVSELDKALNSLQEGKE